jgi:DNA-binding beta-propeller fold protein YncE
VILLSYLYVCNTAADYISKVDTITLKEKKITLCNKSSKTGPHGICSYENFIIIANCYSNSISKVDVINDQECDNFYIGSHCNDVDVYNTEAFITCGDSNNIIVFDMEKDRIVEEIPCGINPHSLDINYRGLIAVSNMESATITFTHANSKDFNKEIRIGSYPIKVRFSKDGRLLYVCESNLGEEKDGHIAIISVDDMKLVKRIVVGKSPVDIFIDKETAYVSNFSEGSISILNLNNYKEEKRIYFSGMPVGIIKKDDFIYVGDSLNNLLIRYSLITGEKKVITIGNEPTGMTLI